MTGRPELHRVSCPYSMCEWKRAAVSAQLAEQLRSDHVRVCIHRSQRMFAVHNARRQDRVTWWEWALYAAALLVVILALWH